MKKYQLLDLVIYCCYLYIYFTVASEAKRKWGGGARLIRNLDKQKLKRVVENLNIFRHLGEEKKGLIYGYGYICLTLP